MGRYITDGDDLIHNLEYVLNESNGKVISLRCKVCNKFIKRDWTAFYCPHCDATFMEGVTAEQQRCVDNLINYLESLEEFMNDDDTM